MPYYKEDDLFESIHNKSNLFNSYELKQKWIVSAVRSVAYLYLNEVIHRDIKSKNFLIKDVNSCELHICDFGMEKNYLNSISTTKGMTTTNKRLAGKIGTIR